MSKIFGWSRVFTLIVLLGVKGKCDIVVKPVHTEVLVGESTYLNCSISDPLEQISWFHYPVGKWAAHDLRYVYANGRLYVPYDKRFQIEKDSQSGAFNLIITQVEVQDAGMYVCQNGGGPEQSATAQLIVIKSIPDCSSNIDARGVIGPNSCRIKEELIQLSCNLNYFGNIAPVLQWTRKKGNKMSIISSLCSDTAGRMTCNYTTTAATIELDGSAFFCSPSRTQGFRHTCKSETVKILYALENKTRDAKTVGDVVTCPTKSSALDCSYKWIWLDIDHQETVSENGLLVINRDGLHRCDANCSFNGINCIFAFMAIKASFSTLNQIDTTTTVIVGTTLAAVIVILVAIVCAIITSLYVIRKIKKKGENKAELESHVLVEKMEEMKVRIEGLQRDCFMKRLGTFTSGRFSIEDNRCRCIEAETSTDAGFSSVRDSPVCFTDS